MVKYVTLFVAVAIGALTSLQSAINTELGKYVGSVASALISFIVGTFTLVIFYLILGEKGLNQITKVPYHLLVGGILGAAFVFGIIKIIPLIGVSAGLAGVIAGQLILAMMIDHFGWFGLPAYHINLQRIIAAILLFIGVNLMGRQG